MNKAMISWGFIHLQCEHCIYYHKTELGILLVTMHVDDFLTVGSNKDVISDFKSQLQTKWTVSDLGEARFCLGIALEHNQLNQTISLSQTALIDRIITQFSLTSAAPVSTPMETGLHLSHQTHSPSMDAQRQHVSYTLLLACGLPDVSCYRCMP